MLKEEFCDRFPRVAHHAWENHEGGDTFVGAATKSKIGHPAICSLMWDNCVLTKFAGVIAADDMTGDAQFKSKPFKADRQHLYTVPGARSFAVVLFVSLAGAWSFFSTAVFRNTIAQPRGLRWYLGVVLLPMVALIALTAGIVFAAVPKLSTSEVQLSRGLRREVFPTNLRASIESLLNDHPDILHRTAQEIAEYILNNVGNPATGQKSMVNAVTGGELVVEDSPGNFTVEKNAEKVVVRVYDLLGRVLVAEHPIAVAEEVNSKE